MASKSGGKKIWYKEKEQKGIIDGNEEKKEIIMLNKLECMISPGQFTGEYAVWGELFDKTGFSLFAEKKDLEFSEEPTFDKPVKGWIRIKLGPQKDDLLLVTLPQPTFENGQTITVKTSQVKNR